MPIVREFPVTRPALASNADTLSMNPSYPFQFAWTPLDQIGVELVLEFTDESEGLGWQVSCWVEDNGSYSISASDLAQMPTQLLGFAAIRRYQSNLEPASEEAPEILFTGVYEHRWNLIFQGANSSL